MAFSVEWLDLAGAALIRPDRFGDERGWFEETWSHAHLAKAGFEQEFVQDNLSFTAQIGTLRGLHYQLAPFAQGKLVSVVSGAVRDIIVDVREGSATYGQSFQIDLTEEDPTKLWCPPGFLHGFVTQRANTRFSYKVTARYSGDHDRSIAWNDPSLALDWGIDNPVLSDKDKAAPTLDQAGTPYPVGSLD